MAHIPQVLAEVDIIAAETRCIIDKTLELGGGDIAIGTVRAFESGVLDIPFAPSRYNAGKVLPARDNSGAVRFMDVAALPFTNDLKNFHRAKLEERGAYEKRPVSYQMLIDDVYSIGKGTLVGRGEK
jgi:methylaspartate mutase epsilon subunit